MKIRTLMKMNIVIGCLSFYGLYMLDYPFELIPASGVAWVLISCFDILRMRWCRKMNVYVVRGNDSLIIYGCFRTRDKAERYKNGCDTCHIIELELI